MARTLVVLDYGSGNLRSAERALRRLGAQVEVTSDASAALAADGLVVPGVGAFAACMRGIDAIDGAQIVRKRLAAGAPVLGICVGFQVLFAYGEEHGERTEGIGRWPGGVTKLEAPVLPHMGWNVVAAPAGSALFAGVADERFYFVHSYAPRSAPGLVTTAEHGEQFVAAVEDGLVSGTQFHPEKSGDAGSQLLSNWLETLS
ncbi:MAG TPA: imidazole glycerol phosphate synthase subunit HisH [Acidothermaceae bacterium]|nr:imidazole glycerol phosphate synthase subunit HisH [Acidothermaceae bacterium]